MTKKITIYTDGSALGNPGPGGWGAVLMSGNHRKELSGGFYETTNNRMELLAIIEALKAIKTTGYSIEVFSDSQYVVNAINKGWLKKWAAKNYAKRPNADLWKKLYPLLTKYQPKVNWVKAHVGIAENEKCDQLAKEAAEQPTKADDGYIAQK